MGEERWIDHDIFVKVRAFESPRQTITRTGWTQDQVVIIIDTHIFYHQFVCVPCHASDDGGYYKSNHEKGFVTDDGMEAMTWAAEYIQKRAER